MSKQPDDAGFRHYRTERPTKPKNIGQNWQTIAEHAAKSYRTNTTAQTWIHARLRLPLGSLDVLPLVSVTGVKRAGNETVFTISFPECLADGTICGITERIPNGDRDEKRMRKGGHRGLTLPLDWASRSGPLFIVEGPTDTAAMTYAGLCCVGRPSNSGGAKLLAELLRNWPTDRPIIVVGENDQKPNGDWPGRNGANSVATKLANQLSRVVRVAMPPTDAKDVRDWLTADNRAQQSWPERGAELRSLLEQSATNVETSSTDGAVIEIGTDEYRVNDEAVAALAHEPDIYQRGGCLVHILEMPDEAKATIRRPIGSPIIRELSRPSLRERLTRCASWVKVGRNDDGEETTKPAHPPDWCFSAVHARGVWPGVRSLDGILAHPILWPDGTLISDNGYHPSARLFLAQPADLRVIVPDAPTQDDAHQAAQMLLDPIADFPFVSDAHRAAFVASLLTPLAWYLFTGPAPMFLIDKNVRGAGAGLLADVVAIIVTGRRFSVMSYTNDREELRKRITTLAMEGERIVLLDNLAGPVGNDVLDAALTADTWKDRKLGGNSTYDGPLHVVWYGTGNNVQLRADTSRRVCHIRMESQDERPELRSGFRYPNLRQHVTDHRGELLSAALTILRAFLIACRPKHNLPNWGSYESWSDTVREAVVFAGLTDPGETREQLQTMADRDASAMADILEGITHMADPHRGITTTEIVQRMRDDHNSAEWFANMRCAVEDLCGKLDGRLLSYEFRRFKRRNFGGRMLDVAGSASGTNRWIVVGAKPNNAHDPHATRGDGGDRGHPSRGRLFTDWSEQMLPD